jgi:hypothetical protein
MMGDDLKAIGMVLIFIIVILAMMYSCSSNPDIPGKVETTETGIDYKEFTINGMPCIYVTQGIGNTRTGGPTCDWSKWRKR